MALTDYVIMPGADYQAACDKLREKTGKTDLIKSGDLAAAIGSIQSGGGSMFASSAVGILLTVYKGAANSEFTLNFESSAVGALSE